jgi:uncharacterized protein YvpB
MSTLHVNHIKNTIEQKFKNKIDVSDLTGKSVEEINKVILTRGLVSCLGNTLTKSFQLCQD